MTLKNNQLFPKSSLLGRSLYLLHKTNHPNNYDGFCLLDPTYPKIKPVFDGTKPTNQQPNCNICKKISFIFLHIVQRSSTHLMYTT